MCMKEWKPIYVPKSFKRTAQQNITYAENATQPSFMPEPSLPWIDTIKPE